MVLLDLPSQPKKTQEKYQYGGYLLFASDFENQTPESTRKRIKGWQKVSKINMLMFR